MRLIPIYRLQKLDFYLHPAPPWKMGLVINFGWAQLKFHLPPFNFFINNLSVGKIIQKEFKYE